LSEGNEFSLTLNEPIYDSELDKSKLRHLAEYFKLEYNDALVFTYYIINIYIYIYIYFTYYNYYYGKILIQF